MFAGLHSDISSEKLLPESLARREQHMNTLERHRQVTVFRDELLRVLGVNMKDGCGGKPGHLC